MLQFTEATENDVDSLLDIYNYYLLNSTAVFDDDAIDMTEFRNRVPVGHGRSKAFCVIVDGEQAGFCFLSQYRNKRAYDRTAEIGLYLKPPFTGRGYGAEIVRHLETAAKASGFDMLVASVSGENLPSIRVFQKLGYSQCAHYRGIAVKFGRKQDILDFQKPVNGLSLV